MEEKNLPDKVDELLTEVVNKDPLILSSISAVPYFGGTLATFFSAKWLQVYQERTAKLFGQLSEHLSDLDEQAIRRDYFDTPEGIDLLIQATERSSKTRSEDKRDLIARILRGASTDYEGKYSPEEYLYLISDLTVRELRVARSIYENRPKTRSEPWSKWIDEVCTQIGIDKTDLHLSLERIASTGLLQKATAHTDDAGALYLSVPAYGEGSSFLVTPAFDRLMEFLQLKT